MARDPRGHERGPATTPFGPGLCAASRCRWDAARAGPVGDCRRRAQAARGLRPTLKRAGDKPLSMELAATSVADSSCGQGAVVVRTGGGARLDLALDRASAPGCHDRQHRSRTGRVADHSATAMLPWAYAARRSWTLSRSGAFAGIRSRTPSPNRVYRSRSRIWT